MLWWILGLIVLTIFVEGAVRVIDTIDIKARESNLAKKERHLQEEGKQW